MPTLVVVAGPIAAGKSTIADLLARAVAAPDRTAVVVDLDDIAFTQRSAPDEHHFWGRAATVAGSTVRAWFDVGADVVVTHGPFFESDGYARLLGGLPPDVEVRHVLLQVSTEVALARVAADTSRGRSKDPDSSVPRTSASTTSNQHCLVRTPCSTRARAPPSTSSRSSRRHCAGDCWGCHPNASRRSTPVGCGHVEGRRQGS